jgi:protein-L-isoaspartate(D-aspartate) O-methyltransferase
MDRKRWWNRPVLRIFLWFGALILLLTSCEVLTAFMIYRRRSDQPYIPPEPPSLPLAELVAQSQIGPSPTTQNEDDPTFSQARQRMVERDLAGRDIDNARVLEVMGRVPRHLFMPEAIRQAAYADRPLPIGENQTISQPYIVAFMTQFVEPKKTSRALDIGTGSGYQAAVLGELCKEVYSIEIVKPLADQAKQRLTELGYKNVTVRHGDGYQGWKEKAPFDVIIVAAAPQQVPQPLIDQLAPGGKLMIPVGRNAQELLLIEKKQDGTVERRSVLPVRFVPMTGKAQQR